MGKKLLILTGAPESKSLNWNPSALLSEFSEPIRCFAGLDRTTSSASGACEDDNAAEFAVWRSIPLENPKHATSISQPTPGAEFNFHGGFQSSPEFFTTVGGETSYLSSQGDDAESQLGRNILSQFHEHSLAVLGDVPSQLVSRSGESQDHLVSFMTDGSSQYLDEATSFVSDEEAHDHLARGPLGNNAASNYLSDLEDIPPASYLTSIEPQTMTVNLIVGVISIEAPRTVQTRWGRTSTLVEVLVGDETKSGFAMTFWTPSYGAAENPLAGLRPQDVLLLQNVALNVFMKKVYGSSLRSNLTKVHLLYRRKLDAEDAGGYYSPLDMASATDNHPQLRKAKKVWDWVLNFVGGNTRRGAGAGVQRAWDMPPPDTQ